MKNELKKVKFVQLRTEGFTYSEISEELGISKPTLISWSRELKSELRNAFSLRKLELQKIYNLTQERQIQLQSNILNKIESAIDASDLKAIPPGKLIELGITAIKNY